MGEAVAGAGDVDQDGFADMVVAAYGDRLGPVWLVPGGPDGGGRWEGPWTQRVQSGLTAEGLACAGDVNGDGADDLIAGTTVVLGGPAGLEWGVWSHLDEPEDTGGGFGEGPGAGAGDVDGDGFADVVVGSSFFAASGEGSGEGAVYVFYGSSTGSRQSGWSRVVGDAAGAALGTSVGGLGDVDGDGFEDVGAGAPFADDGEGAVWVLFGAAEGLAEGEPAVLRSGVEGDALGVWVDGAGDVDGDGFADVLAGATDPLAREAGLPTAGAARLWLGSADGPGGEADWSLASAREGAACGWSVAGLGDIDGDGDGYGDVGVGCPEWDALAYGGGRVAVFTGGPDGPGTEAAWEQVGDAWGWARRCAGPGTWTATGPRTWRWPRRAG